MITTNNKTTVWTSIVEKDKYGDYFIVFPRMLCKQMGWVNGTQLEWVDNQNNSWSLITKK
jgi:hypothetical protein